LQTISNRINQLGLTEPTVQQYGQAGTDYEILVELPGVDDPARVKRNHADHRATGDRRGEGRSFPSREAALAQKGGILPLGTKLVRQPPGRPARGEWYLLARRP
jgi:preprotein translocase subunit SecD